MKKILIITERTLHNAPRVIREIDALMNDFKIYTVGISPPKKQVEKHFDFELIKNSFFVRGTLLLKRKFLKNRTPNKLIYSGKLKKIEKIIQEAEPHIVIIHEPINLPYLSELKQKYQFKLVLNAHEYYPLEYEELPNWKETMQPFYEGIYHQFLPKVDLFVNVCESIRQKCLSEFQKDSLVITNASAYNPIATKLAVNKPIRIIHHGNAIPGRKIEDMIQMMDYLNEDFELHLMLSDNKSEYFHSLAEMIKQKKNVFLIDPVPFDKIIETINQFDMGLYILPPTNFNNSIALPNKFFEFLQAKLCIAIGPSPEMKSLIEQYNLGVVATDFNPKSLAEKILTLSIEDINSYKKNAENIAKTLCAETYNKILLSEILKL